MNISDFNLIEKIVLDSGNKGINPFYGDKEHYFIATVNVTSGWLLFKKTEKKTIYLEPRSYGWRWLDNGKRAPAEEVENLVSAYKAKKRKYNLSDCI